MNILFLGRGDSPVISILRGEGNRVTCWADPLDISLLDRFEIQFAVSHGYRHMIPSSVLRKLPDRIINLHISFLPWNKGADPNLWSFLEDTPKGVTIHFVDEGLDTGDIIAQRQVFFHSPDETLATTYQKLQAEMIRLFQEMWPLIKVGRNPRQKQTPGGTFHRSSDKQAFQGLLTLGWDTPVRNLTGKALRAGGDRVEP